MRWSRKSTSKRLSPSLSFLHNFSFVSLSAVFPRVDASFTLCVRDDIELTPERQLAPCARAGQLFQYRLMDPSVERRNTDSLRLIHTSCRSNASR